MQRCVNDFEFICNRRDRIGIDSLRRYVGKIFFIHFLTDNGHKTALECLVKGHLFHVCKNIKACNFCGNRVSMLGGELCAVFPICLVSVVFLRVVRSGNIDARYATKLAQSKGELGGGAKRIEQIYFDAICGKNRSRSFGKGLRIQTAIASDCHTVIGATFANDQIGKTLCSVCNGMNVHCIESGFHSAAQTGGSKRKSAREAQSNLIFILFNGAKFCFFGIGQDICLQPFVIGIPKFFHKSSSVVRNVWTSEVSQNRIRQFFSRYAESAFAS